jgi:hypothetical protein
VTGRRPVWSTQSVNRDTWVLFRGAEAVAEVFWIRELRHPHLTMQRIVDGLNVVHGDSQPARTWSFASEGSAYDIRHNGVTVGELSWRRLPTTLDLQLGRVLAGLNWQSPSRAETAPEPLPADRRHLRAVS